MKEIMSLSGLAVVLSLMVGSAGRAEAGLITYTEQVTGSGSLNGVAFTNQLVTLTFTGDTANIVHNSGGSAGFTTNFPATGTLKVGAGATGNFITDTYGIYSNVNANVGLYDVTRTATILAAQNAAVGNYDLSTAFSISGSTFVRGDQTFSTSLGGFVLSSTSTNATFTAVLSGAAVPEPSSLTMCGIGGVVGLVVTRRRHKWTA